MMVGVGDFISGRGPFSGVPIVLRAGGQTWRATPDRPWTIGRAAESDVRLDDPRVSRHHATLESTPDGWVLVNHGGNGMFVDGRRVERLAVGDPVTVSLGAQSGGIIVQMQPEPAPAPDAAVTEVVQVAQNRPPQPAHLPPASAQPSQLPPANWYPDPEHSGRLRYFNGTDWTDQYSAPSAGQQAGQAVQGGGYPAGPPSYSLAPGGSPPPAVQPPSQPGPDEARVFQIRLHRHTGMVIIMLRQSFVFTGTLEQCERAYRQAQIYNLTAGWWGILSALVFNWIALFSNMSAIGQVRRMAQQPPAGPIGQSPPMAQPPAGWYPDPSGAPGQRYWDGARWTH
jgi:FHA domain-containing protein/uncharacterized protein DUF2510